MVGWNQKGTRMQRSETWKPVRDYEGIYEVSNLGRILSHHYGVRRELQPRITSMGYRKPTLYRNGERNPQLLHRLVAEAFIPNPSNKPEINHIDGDKLNNSTDNLEWTTHAENMAHAAETGLLPDRCGEKNPRSRLMAEQVYEIRALRAEGLRLTEIGAMFDVSKQCVCEIVHGRRWKHL